MPDENELIELENNAEEIPEEIEGELKETEEQKEEEVVEKESVNSSGEKEDDGEKMVQGVIDKVLGTEEKKEEEGTDIPDAFTKACLAEGWTEEEIKEFAQDLDDKDLLAELIIEEKEEPAKQEAKEEKSKPAEKSGDKPTNEKLAALEKKYEKRIADLEAKFGKATEEKATKDEEAMVQTVNQAFDEVSENFKIFGKTEELLKYPAGPKKGQVYPMSPAMKARQEVWDKAAPFVKSGIPVKDAMAIALTWYKGANLEKDVERNLIKGLKEHETKLSAKRVGKRTVRTFEDEEERKAEVVLEARRKAKAKHRT